MLGVVKLTGRSSVSPPLGDRKRVMNAELSWGAGGECAGGIGIEGCAEYLSGRGDAAAVLGRVSGESRRAPFSRSQRWESWERHVVVEAGGAGRFVGFFMFVSVQSHGFLVRSGGGFISLCSADQGTVFHKIIFLESRDRTW